MPKTTKKTTTAKNTTKRSRKCGGCRRIKKNCKCGRPTVMTPEVLNKLDQAFMFWMNNTEACLYADIAEKNFYNYAKANDGYLQKAKSLREKPSMVAKANIVRSIQAGDKNDSKRWLERKNKDEFSLKTEVDQTTRKVKVLRIWEKSQDSDVE